MAAGRVALVLVCAGVTGCGGAAHRAPGRSSSSPAIRSAEHDAREAQARTYTAPDGTPIPPEPQDPEPNHGTPGSQDATGGKVDVPIRDGRFMQPRMTVEVGQIVVFTDDDHVPHTVWRIGGGLPRSGVIPVGGRFEFTPLRPGVVRYHDVLHPRMRGELIVAPHPATPFGTPARSVPGHRPSCRDLSRSARHELGDPSSEMSTHCRRG